MVRQVHAIFSQGAFQPIEPVALPEGTRVHLSVEEEVSAGPVAAAAMMHTPKLARREDARVFLMEVRETGDADA
jgi:predicted DNA-binding antitoxin AbrB/MazE fold protein